MNNREALNILEKNKKGIEMQRQSEANTSPQQYRWKNLIELRKSLNNLSKIEFLREEIENFKLASPLFGTSSDTLLISSSDDTKAYNFINSLKTGLYYLEGYVSNSLKVTPHNTVAIKLPEIKSFEDLAKVSNELKKSFEIPLRDSSENGDLKIISAEEGSIWLYVEILAGINLIAGICWSAAVIRKKMAEARIYEEHTKTLGLKNESLQLFVDAQKQQLQNILQAEAESIAAKNYSAMDNEAIERLKLSITTVVDLLDKGTIILPANNDDKELKKLFPDYSQLSLIESTIRQLQKPN
jgi:hypothetical protein